MFSPLQKSHRDLGGILAGSHRDSRRVLPRFWPPGFPFPAVNPGGILAGLPPGSRRDFGNRDFASRRERWRDRPPRFWPPSFRSPPSIPAGSWRDYHRDPAEILAAGISLRAQNPSGNLARIPTQILAAGVLLPAENPVGILVGSLTKILVAEIPVSR